MRTKALFGYCFITTLALVASLFSPLAAANNCRGSIAVQVDTNNITEQYDDYVEVLIPVTIKLKRKLYTCADTIVLQAVDNNSFVMSGSGGNAIAEFVDENGVSLPQLSTSTPAWLLTPSGNRDTRMYLKIVGEQILSPGRYRGTLNVAAFQQGVELNDKTATIRYDSPSLVGMSMDTSSSTYINGSNGIYVVDFGELQQGKVVDWSMNLISNSNVNITFDSDNKNLVHESNSNELIEYTVYFGENIVSVDGSKIGLETFTGMTSLPISIEIGNVDHKLAGNYTDQLYITVSAN